MIQKDILRMLLKARYSTYMVKGNTLLRWAVLWFKMSNDDFFRIYGFNFNPHDYPMLYEIARDEVYGRK